MISSKRCYLCGTEGSGSGLSRLAGFDVCDGCLRGDLSARLRSFGISVEGDAREVSEQVHSSCGYGSAEIRTFFEISIAGTCPVQTELGLVLGRETVGGKLLKLFKREIQVGDPLFDEAILVRCRGDEQAARDLLADDNVQSAIMELVGPEGRVTIEGNRIDVFTVHEDYSALETCLVLSACLLTRLSRTP
ncbi:MAG: hypothetical protein R6V85_13895 [Polyangia bacterium]